MYIVYIQNHKSVKDNTRLALLINTDSFIYLYLNVGRNEKYRKCLTKSSQWETNIY